MRPIAVIGEVELLVGAVQIIGCREDRHFVFRHEGHVGGGNAVPLGQRSQPFGECSLHSVARQRAIAVIRRGPVAVCKGDGALQFRVIMAAGPLQRIGPTVVEDIFAWLWFFR